MAQRLLEGRQAGVLVVPRILGPMIEEEAMRVADLMHAHSRHAQATEENGCERRCR
jgi:hypothetical protein